MAEAVWMVLGWGLLRKLSKHEVGAELLEAPRSHSPSQPLSMVTLPTLYLLLHIPVCMPLPPGSLP